VSEWGEYPHFFIDVEVMSRDLIEKGLETRVEALGYEFVELEWAGSRSRPILRLRIDLPASSPGGGVTLEDCARVSRELESVLDEEPEFGGRYLLEVSSPGVDRPLIRRRDFERFAGREIAIRGDAILAGRARRLEGELVGLVEMAGEEQVRLRLNDGSVVDVPRAEVTRAHLVYRWDAG
jgi:ribosome maturation factor RimP